MAEIGHPFEQVGITGYPESHPLISDAATIKAMFAKARFATYIVSQVCFDSKVTPVGRAVWARGTRLPIYIGSPVRSRARSSCGSATHRASASRCGSSAPRNGSSHAVRPGGFSPTRRSRGSRQSLGDPERKLGGFHIFTFNDVADTEHWRQRHSQARAS